MFRYEATRAAGLDESPVNLIAHDYTTEQRYVDSGLTVDIIPIKPLAAPCTSSSITRLAFPADVARSFYGVWRIVRLKSWNHLDPDVLQVPNVKVM